NATIYIEAGDAAGGAVYFGATSTGGTARAVLAGSGVTAGGLDISPLTAVGMSIGSIEGSGIIGLGSKRLTVGTNNLSTVFSGLVRDEAYYAGVGGQLTKVGTGALNLTGNNTYTGLTTIDAGALAVNGSIVGDVQVNAGGTLKGSGTIGGTV